MIALLAQLGLLGLFEGLPTHPFVVHLPVVLVPLATIGVIAMAIRPRWLRTFGPVVTALAAVGFVASIIASRSGETLEDEYRAAGETISTTLRDHAEAGERVPLLAGLFLLLLVVWVVFARWRSRAGDERATEQVRRPKQLAVALALLTVLSAGAASAAVYQAGHSGASSVWEDEQP